MVATATSIWKKCYRAKNFEIESRSLRSLVVVANLYSYSFHYFLESFTADTSVVSSFVAVTKSWSWKLLLEINFATTINASKAT